jgi:hypothetical protein
MKPFDDVFDFITIDNFLTDMVRCGAISESRYAELMGQLQDAFDRRASIAKPPDVMTTTVFNPDRGAVH